MKLPPMNTLRPFEAVARLGGISKAAEELCVSQGAVSQQIRNLENHLNCELFHRRGNSLELTDDGKYLFPIVREALQHVADAADELMRKPDVAQLQISTWHGFATACLMPRLDRFYGEYGKDVTVSLNLSTDIVNFTNDGIDAAIRFGDGDFGDHLDCILLFQPRVTAVASPDYLESHEKIESLSKPRNQTLIDHFYPLRELRKQHVHWDDVVDGNLQALGNSHLTFPDQQQSVNAAILGQGVALSILAMIEQQLASDKIRVAAPGSVPAKGSIFFVRPRAARPNPALDAFCQWLVEEFARYR